MATNQIHQGQQLKEYLGAKGINLSDLAKKLGTKRQYFYRWFLLKTLDKTLLEKLTLVTGFVITDAPDNMNPPDLEKEIIRLREKISFQDKIIEAQQKALSIAEHLIAKSHKSLAHATTPKKN